MASILFRVRHPDHGAVEVAAVDRVRAVSAAAATWGVTRWTTIARGCTVEELGPADKREKRRVLKIRRDGSIVKRYPSARAAALDNYMSVQSVLDRCNGKIKKPFAADGCSFVFEK